ncbi:MAG: hypothetical protein KF819_40125 [Labilithrix sp.]|nr:hypothetical protein [Labilithrix sp.]
MRKNDWWPESIVSGWMEKRAAATRAPEQAVTSVGTAKILREMAALHEDPFQGAVERRVMDAGMQACDMEVRAAEEAIARAGIDRREIDLLLCHTTVPEYLLTNTACLLHQRLGLATECFTMVTEAAANSFLMQLTLAEQMIAGGRAKKALLVQSCSVSRLLDPADPLSPLFGDAASAVVVGAVSSGRGILGTTQRTDGSANRTLIASVRGKSWYHDGPIVLYSADPIGARRVFLETADLGKDVVDVVLKQSGYGPSDVDYFAVHQGTPWFPRVMKEHFELGSAKAIESFPSTGYTFAVSIPLGLSMAEKAGMLASDDLVLMYGGGTGLTHGATLLRWDAA